MPNLYICDPCTPKGRRMNECSTGELFARAAFMHHDDQGHNALKHHVALKGLVIYLPGISGSVYKHICPVTWPNYLVQASVSICYVSCKCTGSENPNSCLGSAGMWYRKMCVVVQFLECNIIFIVVVQMYQSLQIAYIYPGLYADFRLCWKPGSFDHYYKRSWDWIYYTW